MLIHGTKILIDNQINFLKTRFGLLASVPQFTKLAKALSHQSFVLQGSQLGGAMPSVVGILTTYYCLHRSDQQLWCEAPSCSPSKHSLDHELDFSLTATATQRYLSSCVTSHTSIQILLHLVFSIPSWN